MVSILKNAKIFIGKNVKMHAKLKFMYAKSQLQYKIHSRNESKLHH